MRGGGALFLPCGRGALLEEEVEAGLGPGQSGGVCLVRGFQLADDAGEVIG